jgi:hypothetical protein
MTTISSYCTLCGCSASFKAITTIDTRLCKPCKAIVSGPLKQAFKLWLEMGKDHTRCCGGLSSDKTHLYFHGRHWDSSYGEPGLRVSVEMGISFYAHKATTYYMRDFDHHCDSEEYGQAFLYRGMTFFKRIDKQLNQAAQFAFGSDLLTCEVCGYHTTADDAQHGHNKTEWKQAEKKIRREIKALKNKEKGQ